MGFQVLTPATMKMTAFWVIQPCSLVEVNRRFSNTYCPHQDDRPDDGGSAQL
jgi:hypothetical protein